MNELVLLDGSMSVFLANIIINEICHNYDRHTKKHVHISHVWQIET